MIVMTDASTAGRVRDGGASAHPLASRVTRDQLDLLARFPKRRATLPERYQLVYADEYHRNREGHDLASRVGVSLESWMHQVVARGGRASGAGRLLEIGAGTLNHVRYESDVVSYDIIEPFAELVQRSGRQSSVRHVYGTIEDLPTAARYDRMVSIAVLEHVLDLPRLIATSCLHLEERGLWQAAIPSEGAFLWQVGWRIKGIPFRLRTGLDYGFLTHWEHVNDAREIESLISLFFEDVAVDRFPTKLFHASFYTYIEARRPRMEIAREYLEAYPARID